MSIAKLNQPVDDFEFQATNQIDTKISQYRGKIIVLYFYPKDNTPGCTQESKDFRDLYQALSKLDVVVFGISRDSLSSHEKFKQKYELPFELISDPDEKICQQFEVIRPNVLFGKKYLGISRSTFIIDADQVLRAEWRKVKVKQHAQQVLDFINTLK